MGETSTLSSSLATTGSDMGGLAGRGGLGAQRQPRHVEISALSIHAAAWPIRVRLWSMRSIGGLTAHESNSTLEAVIWCGDNKPSLLPHTRLVCRLASVFPLKPCTVRRGSLQQACSRRALSVDLAKRHSVPARECLVLTQPCHCHLLRPVFRPSVMTAQDTAANAVIVGP